ncbi:MAG: DNA translocase FtsK 4TM domain-containing protein [Alphaproteobacteria bacterium]|nr:DNA translocase FtsK 4TM domain-containing protein [Alphaproteobacteria bacterium]
MAASSRRSSSTWLPESFSEGLSRLKALAAGSVVIAAAFFLAFAFFSYTSSDPSFNTAAVGPLVQTHNLGGRWGAYSADLLWQLFGLGGILLPLAIAAWGWRLVSQQGIERLGWRVVALLASMAAVSIALSATGLALAPEHAGFYGSLGRVSGPALASLLSFPGSPYVLSALFGLLACLGVYLSCALSVEEWRTLALWVHEGALFVIDLVHDNVLAAYAWIRAKLRRRDAFDDDAEDIEEGAEEEEVEEDNEGEEEEEEEEEEENIDEPPPQKSSRKTRRSKAPLIKRPVKTTKQSRFAFAGDEDYPPPPLDFLHWPDNAQRRDIISKESLEKNAKILESVLDDFGVNGHILKVSPGPVVTLYELEPAPGTRASRVVSLADDIARNMSAVSVRVATVPGRNVIGIELPNARRETVYLRELLSSTAYHDTKATLPLVLGKNIAGNPVLVDLAKMPHLLIAGTTGSGKSVAINTMILSLLYRLPPQKCRFIMIDPKMLELSVYDGIPHLLTPVVTDPKKAIMALRWTVREMEDRYRAMSKLGVRNVDGYNARLREAASNDEVLMRTVQTGFDRETGKPIYEEQPLDLTELPFIVVIVDEMADLMMVAGKEIEAAIQRLAQMARAAGIHIMMATQRPSVDVITGTIKANFPTRISFQVTSKIDSRTILGEQGAEQLLGQGDMLYMAGGGRITRVHGPFVRDDEVEQIVKFLKAQGKPDYLDAVTEDDGSDTGSLFGGGAAGGAFGKPSGDDLYDKAVDIVLRERKASTSFIQRQLQIGYNKAATLVERMEREGLIGPASPTGKREIFAGDSSND